MNHYLDRLIAKAEAILQAGYPLPLDLLTELAAAGIDLSTFDH
jgi:hypothetical protein